MRLKLCSGCKPRGTHGRRLAGNTEPLHLFYTASNVATRPELYIKKTMRALTVNATAVQDATFGPLPAYSIVETEDSAFLIWRNQRALFNCANFREKRRRFDSEEEAQSRKRPKNAPSYSGNDSTNSTGITESREQHEIHEEDNSREGDTSSNKLASHIDAKEEGDGSGNFDDMAPISQVRSFDSFFESSGESHGTSAVSEDTIALPDSDDSTTEAVAQDHPPDSNAGKDEIAFDQHEDPGPVEHAPGQDLVDHIRNASPPESSPAPPPDPSTSLVTTAPPCMDGSDHTNHHILQHDRQNFIKSMNLIRSHRRLYHSPTDMQFPRHRFPPYPQPLTNEDVHLAIASIWTETHQRLDIAYAKPYYLSALSESAAVSQFPKERFKGSSTKNRILLPITIHNDPEHGKGIGHHILAIAHQPGSDPNVDGGGIRLHFWDSAPSAEHRERGRQTVERMIQDSGFFNCGGGWPYYLRPHWHSAAKQREQECGVHVVLNAWAWLLDLRLCARDPRRNYSSRMFPRSFYRTARGVINLAMGGRMSRECVRRFLVAYGYVEDGSGDGDGVTEGDVEWEDDLMVMRRGCLDFRTRVTTAGSFDGFIDGLD